MKKEDLSDVTFLIPIRIDSVIRLENLLAVVSYINRNFITEIHVLEAAPYDNGITKRLIPNNVNLLFVEDDDIIFHRTHYINYMCSSVKTKIVAVWDADVIIPRQQIIDTIIALRNNMCDFSYPYNGLFLNTGMILRNYFINNQKINFLKSHVHLMNVLYGKNSVGGAFFIIYEKYKDVGLENELFYGWGFEDFERVVRFNNYGLKMHRSNGPLFHLSHPRDINGNHSNVFQQERSEFLADLAVHRTKDNIINQISK